MLEDVFQMLIFQQEKEQANPIRRSDISQKLEQLSKVGLSKSKIQNNLMQLKQQLTVGPDEWNKEFTLYKKGGTFGGIETRPCRAQTTTFGQVKSRGSSDFLDKKQQNTTGMMI